MKKNNILSFYTKLAQKSKMALTLRILHQQDSASAYRARETVKVTESLDTILHSARTLATDLPNSPDLSPVNCTVLSVMQEKVYQHPINEVGELRCVCNSAWDELDQRVIDTAVRQW